MPNIQFDCPKCAQTLDASEEWANQLIECPACKETIEVPTRSRSVTTPVLTPPPIPAPVQSARAGDDIFFSAGGVTVSRTRFVVDAQTFVLANISSVRGVETPPNWTAPILPLLIGALLLLLSIWLGLLVIGACIAWLCFQKPRFSVVLTAAGGEVTAYSSYDRAFISRVIQALTEAIVARG